MLNQSLVDAVARRAVSCWHADLGLRIAGQSQGVRHAKATVGDATSPMLNSANLTEDACLLNMEIGVSTG
jgi:hypothetical protein